MSFEYCNELVGNVSRHAPIIEPPAEAGAMKVPFFAMTNNIVQPKSSILYRKAHVK
jgi:hypothetical protein